MEITRVSPFTGEETTLDLPVTEEQYQKYLDGYFVQDAFPNLSADDREFILTGITKKDWETIFKEE